MLEGLEGPRGGNASLHDFYELQMIALCACCVAAKAQWTWRGSRRPKILFCAAFSAGEWPTQP